MTKKVRWKPGFSSPVSCEVVVQRFEHLRSQSNDGRVTPATIVADARSPRSVLHKAFNWNDKEEAELHRQDVARRMLRSVEIIRTADNGEKSREIAYVSVAEPFKEGSGGYKATSEALTESRELVLGLAWSQLKAWEKRWGRLNEFADVVDAIAQTEPPTT